MTKHTEYTRLVLGKDEQFNGGTVSHEERVKAVAKFNSTGSMVMSTTHITNCMSIVDGDIYATITTLSSAAGTVVSSLLHHNKDIRFRLSASGYPSDEPHEMHNVKLYNVIVDISSEPLDNTDTIISPSSTHPVIVPVNWPRLTKALLICGAILLMVLYSQQ